MNKNIMTLITVIAMILCFITDVCSAGEASYLVNAKTMKLGDNFANYYLLHLTEPSDSKNKNLLIYLDGSGLAGALGEKLEKKDFYINILNRLNRDCQTAFDMLVPEKMNIGLVQGSSNHVEALSHYTLHDRVYSAVAIIDNILKKSDYNQVILVGASEGGAILPKVYNNLQYRHKVSKLISLAGGGLSQYEELKILQKSNLPIPSADRDELMKLDTAIQEIGKYPTALDKTYYGMPYKYWSGFMSYRPVDEFINITIPILVIHGSEDINTPVESSRAISERFAKENKTNLTYIEYPKCDHFWGEKFDVVLNDMGNWIKL